MFLFGSYYYNHCSGSRAEFVWLLLCTQVPMEAAAAAAAAAAVAVGGGGAVLSAAGTTPTAPSCGNGGQRDDPFGCKLGYVWPADLSSRGVAADGTVHESLPAMQGY